MSFLGMPIEGQAPEPYRANRAEQYPVEHFQEKVAKILSYDVVEGIAWYQYTPYFNDGDPCIFRAGDPSFAFKGVEFDPKDHYFEHYWAEEDYEATGRVWCGQYENGQIFDAIVGKDDRVWGPWSEKPRTWTYAADSGPENAPDPELFNDIQEFIRLFDGGHYNHAVEDLFGDHVIVRIDKLANKVIIDEYDHD